MSRVQRAGHGRTTPGAARSRTAWYPAGALGLALLLGLTAAGCAPGRLQGRPAPYNAVVVVLDTSDSFRRPWRQPGLDGKIPVQEALGVVQRLFQEAAAERQRRTAGKDQYFLVAADGASQLIWSGTREQLSRLTPEALATALDVRRAYAACTDLEAALNEAAVIVHAHPDAERWVLVFSDLLHEPPRGSYAACVAPSGEPPAGIRWDELAGARLGFYFVSKAFPYRPDRHWRAELERRGLRAIFLDAPQTLTAGVAVTPPPPARYRVTEGDVRAAQEQLAWLRTALWRVAWYGAAGGRLVLGAFIGGLAWRRRRLAGRRRS